MVTGFLPSPLFRSSLSSPPSQVLVRAAMDIFSHGVHIYIPVYHWDENSLWLPSPKVVVFSQKEASMLICGENVHSCCVQRRAQTHVKRFHTFACDAVGLQCWVNLFGCFFMKFLTSSNVITAPSSFACS